MSHLVILVSDKLVVALSVVTLFSGFAFVKVCGILSTGGVTTKCETFLTPSALGTDLI